MRSMQLKTFSAALMVFAVSTASASTIDTATQGNWIGVYGGNGYILNSYIGTANSPQTANDLASLPSYVSSYSYGNTSQYQWTGSTTDVRAPENPLAANPLTDPRVAATAYNDGSYSVTLNLNHAESFQLGVYGLDWDNYNGRDMTITVNGDTARFNNTTIAHAYNNGEWALFNITNAPVGPLVISFTQNAPTASNSVISAITFDHGVPTPEPSTFILGGLGLVGLFVAARRSRKA